MIRIYRKYFSKDRPLRHLTQHILVGILGCFVIYLIVNKINPKLVFVFFLSTFLIDLDGIFAIFVYRRNNKFSNRIRSKVKSKDFKGAFYLASKEHKNLDKLILHNFVVFTLVSLFWYMTLKSRNLLIFYSLSGILVHMIFDIFDDFVNLGHVKHWFFAS